MIPEFITKAAATSGSTREAISEHAYVQNILYSYLVELIEYRAGIQSAMKMGKDAPTYFENFLLSFTKLYELCSSMLNTPAHLSLKAKIEKWIRMCDPTNKQSKTEGIELSLQFQHVLERERVFTLFEEPIAPPYISIIESVSDEV